MRVKICGITNKQDALDAIEAGASALGFVFYKKSARYIEPSKAKEIISYLPPFVQMVGLFVNNTAQEINNIAKISSIDIAQLHYNPQEDDFYDKLNIKYLNVTRAKKKNDILQYQDKYRIVDAFVPQYGGEGKRIDLSWFDNVDCSKIILAGGIDINNISQLKGYNFYSLDLSSGVEQSRGIKSKEKMISFMKAVDELFR